MKVVAVIPARYGSTRFPGKPLALICDKPLLQWVIEGVQQSKAISKLIVATDDKRILDLAESLGVKAVMTASELPSGSDRVWAAVKSEDCDVVVNIQGDEPLITGDILDQLVDCFEQSSKLEMSTLAEEISPNEIDNSNIVKLITNKNNEAIYFSRFNMPYSRKEYTKGDNANLKHIGLYAYKKSFLKKFCEQSPVAIEESESLEQLRALYLGAKIKVIKVKHQFKGVDTLADAKDVEKIIRLRSH